MKRIILGFMTTMMLTVSYNQASAQSQSWVVDRFDDIRVIRYQVPEFENLPLDQKLYIYYLSQAALCGRDILFDQNFKYNLAVRRTLEAIYNNFKGNRTGEQWASFEKYLKKVWFANGIHHHYSGDKYRPTFTQAYFDELIGAIPAASLPADFGPQGELLATVRSVIFDPNLYPSRANQQAGVDMVAQSANNYYEGLTQSEVEDFYAKMVDPSDKTPISYGLNSKLIKENGVITERVYKVGGMYSAALERVVFWLQKAAEVASPVQKVIIGHLVDYYKTGDLRKFDLYNIAWVKDTESRVDFVNGFIENYGDPMGIKSSWEANASFVDQSATKRTDAICSQAQWFEDNSPVDAKYKKKVVKGVSAKVINVAIVGGDCYPATPLGINLPNADWIRKDYGSKSVTIDNISAAYNNAAKGSGFNEEFVLRQSDNDLLNKYGSLADNLHTDMHECLGHGSGQLAPQTKGDELRNYGSPLEEARADLFALYYLGDPKLVEMGILPNKEAYKASYIKYLMNGMMTQFTRIELGKNVEQAHMRNRKLVSEWVYERGKADGVVEKVVKDGKTYIVINDFQRLRGLFGELLNEIQRIKSEGDYKAGKELIERYAVKIDPALHKEVLDRYSRLNIEPYAGFINPRYTLVEQGGKVVDVKLEYCNDYPAQMLEYSKDHSFLPTIN